MLRLKPDLVPNEFEPQDPEAGVIAPDGGNMQRWRFPSDQGLGIKRRSGAYYKRCVTSRLRHGIVLVTPPPHEAGRDVLRGC